MADKPGYELVFGDGGRSSGLIRRRIAVENGGGADFLDLSLGSIYNSPSSLADDDGVSPLPRALLPAVAAPLDASAPSVVAAATAANAPASSAPEFALGLASSAVPAADGNGHGPVLVLAANDALAAAAPALSSVLPPLFASPVRVPVHGANVSAMVPAVSDSGATPARRSKGAVASSVSSPSSAPPALNQKAPPPRGRRGNAMGRRRRSGAGDDVGATDADSAPPPFPWATKTAGSHPTLVELLERGIASVEGEVRCKRCDAGKTISYDIRAKFEELSGYIVRNVEAMHDRAPSEWMYPALPDCDKCGQKNSLRPVIAAQKWKINWMFLLLGQTLGLCTLEQLKHFCARTRQHRTGAKDRVLYSTYMELCNQLCPGGPFDMASERKNRTRPFA